MHPLTWHSNMHLRTQFWRDCVYPDILPCSEKRHARRSAHPISEPKVFSANLKVLQRKQRPKRTINKHKTQWRCLYINFRWGYSIRETPPNETHIHALQRSTQTNNLYGTRHNATQLHPYFTNASNVAIERQNLSTDTSYTDRWSSI